jgi:FtsH-binding integral membrane protein
MVCPPIFQELIMSQGYEYGVPAAYAAPDARAAFIRRTYGHLAGAILAFTALEAVLLQIPGVGELSLNMFRGFTWLIVLAAFMGVSWLANSWARSNTSRGLQYLGLALYVGAEAVIFLPLLYIADHYFPGTITSAAFLTLAMFGGLTVAVFVTRRDFSYLGPILSIASLLALGFIVAAMFIGMNGLVGLIFCFFMVAVACGYIVYYTSNVLHHYRTDQYVAAALALFASVALLFWYVLQILMSVNRR